MPIQQLILGTLVSGPASGYRVVRRLESLPGVRSVASNRVYGMLKELARRGSIEARGRTDAGPEGRTFELTQRGRTELELWLERPVDASEWLRRGLLAKLSIDDSGMEPSPRVLSADLERRRRTLAGLARSEVAASGALPSLLAARARRHLEIEIALLERLLADRVEPVGAGAVNSAPKPAAAGSVSSRPKPAAAGSGSR